MKRSTISIHYGRKGSGKSYHAKRLAEKVKGPLAIWDPVTDWTGRGKDGLSCRATVVRDLGAFARVTKERGGARIARVLIFQLEDDQFDLFVRWCLKVGKQTVIVDEAPLVFPSNGMPPLRKRLVTTSRHAGVDLVLCAQRPAQLHPNIRSQADIVRAWKTTERRDLDVLAELCGSQWAKTLSRLGRYKFQTHKA